MLRPVSGVEGADSLQSLNDEGPDGRVITRVYRYIR